MDCSLPGSSAHGILLARILEWVAVLFSRGSFWPRDWTCGSCIAGEFLTVWATREALSQVSGFELQDLPFEIIVSLYSSCFTQDRKLSNAKVREGAAPGGVLTTRVWRPTHLPWDDLRHLCWLFTWSHFHFSKRTTCAAWQPNCRFLAQSKCGWVFGSFLPWEQCAG